QRKIVRTERPPWVEFGLSRLTGKPASNFQSAASAKPQPELSQCCHCTLPVPSHARRRARPIVIASVQTNPAQCAAKKMGRSHELNSFLPDIDIVRGIIGRIGAGAGRS